MSGILLTHYPHPSELAPAHNEAAECHRSLGDTDSAVRHYRLALRIESQFPKVRTSAAVEFPWWIATERMTPLYDEALLALESAALETGFPIERFRAHASRALIAEARGDRMLASQHATAALAAADLRESGFRYHRWLGLVGSRHDRIVHRLRKLAAA